MFNNIPEMIEYLNKLKTEVDKQIENAKIKLNNTCECCKNKPIEVIYKSDNFTEEYIEDNQIKYKLNAHFFCVNCYEHVIKTKQIEKSSLMAEIDKQFLEEI